MSSPAEILPNIEIIYTSAACDACDKYHVCLWSKNFGHVTLPSIVHNKFLQCSAHCKIYNSRTCVDYDSGMSEQCLMQQGLFSQYILYLVGTIHRALQTLIQCCIPISKYKFLRSQEVLKCIISEYLNDCSKP